MKKFSVFMLSVLVLGLLLAACSSGGNQTTPPPSTVGPGEATPASGLETSTPATGGEPTLPVVTEASTAMATEAPTVALPTSAPATPAATAALPNTGRESPSLLSNLVNYPVVDTTGEKIGDVNDMIVNLGSQRVDYVLVDPDDALNISEGRLLVPWSAMNLTTSASGTMTGTNTITNSAALDNGPAFMLNVNRDAVVASPVVTDTLDLTLPDWDASFLDYWRTQGGVSLTGLGAGNVVTNTSGITGTNGVTTTVATMPLGGYLYAKELMGKNLINTNNDDLGEVQDAVLDNTNGDIQYLIVATGGFLGIGEKLVPLPVKAFSLDQNGNFVLSITEDQLKSAPNFDMNSLPDTSISGWDDALKAYWNEIIK